MSIPCSVQRNTTFSGSSGLLEQARSLIPGLTSSMMKRPEQFAPGKFPTYLARGEGALVTDVDGNEYIDFVCGLGANSLGHGHPAVVEGIRAALEDGILHSLPVPREISAARALVDAIPRAEMARFFKTGADATSAALRLARATTGKERIITVGYNGWHDHFMYDTPGVPEALRELTTRLPLFLPADEERLLDAVRSRKEQLAAVLLSLPYGRVVERAFLERLRGVCAECGVLFVLDEIVTGFRLARGGAQEFYDVQADYVCVSKALAAGMPLSAVVGPRKYLEAMEGLQVSTTFGGEQLSLAACEAALEVYRTTNYFEHIGALGRKLRDAVNAISERVGAPLRVRGYDAIPFFLFDLDPARHATLMRTFQGEMALRGVLLRRDVNFLCGAHTVEQIDFSAEAARESLESMKMTGAFG